MGKYLVEGRIDEAHELDLRNRSQAIEGHADGGPDNARFGKGRIHDPLRAEDLQQPVGYTENAAVLSNVFTEQHDPVVPLHLFPQGQVDGLYHITRRHRPSPPVPWSAGGYNSRTPRGKFRSSQAERHFPPAEPPGRSSRGFAFPVPLIFLAPVTTLFQKAAQSFQRIPFPPFRHFIGVPVAIGIVGRGMVGNTVGKALDEGRTAAAASPLQGLSSRCVDGEDIIAVHLYPLEAVRESLLGQGGGGRLPTAGHGDGPLVVLADEHHRQAKNAGHVESFVEITLGGRAVTEIGDHGNRVAAIPGRHGRTHGMGDVGSHRNGNRQDS